MTIAHKYPARNKWRCDSCGKEEFWNKNWYQYSSLLDEETLPGEDIVTVCSDACKELFCQMIKEGKVVIRKAKNNGYSVEIVGERKGY